MIKNKLYKVCNTYVNLSNVAFINYNQGIIKFNSGQYSGLAEASYKDIRQFQKDIDKIIIDQYDVEERKSKQY